MRLFAQTGTFFLRIPDINYILFNITKLMKLIAAGA